jgi:hypothetical protein
MRNSSEEQQVWKQKTEKKSKQEKRERQRRM